MDDLVESKAAAPVGLLQLAGVLLKVGATGFGGAMPMLALIHTEYLEKRRWVSQEEFDEAVMVGQIMPGPIAVDAITHLGYRLRGWPGALVSWFAFILPSFLLMLVLTLAYMRYGGIPQFVGIFKGLGAGVVAVIAAAAWRISASRGVSPGGRPQCHVPSPMPSRSTRTLRPGNESPACPSE